MNDFDPRRHTPRPDELEGRVIAITGPTEGMGRALARACGRHGATVVLIGRTVRKLEAVNAEIVADGSPEPSIAPFDLEKALAPDYDRIAAAVLERYGRLDGLVHNAAMLGTLAPIEHYDVPTWLRVLHVNVTAAFALTQVLLPAIKRSRDASILFTSSSVGRRGRAFWGAYSAAKFAVEGLAQTLADELESDGIVRVNAINPGPMRTRLRRQAYPSENLETRPAPEDLVGPYVTLLGPAGRGVTGRSFDCQ